MSWWAGYGDEFYSFEIYEDAIRIPSASVCVESTARTAKIRDSSGETYDVTLENCTCNSFEETLLPCAHMCRLAIELGLIPTLADKKWWIGFASRELAIFTRALMIAPISVSLDSEARTAKILGSTGETYDVSLAGCTCRYFERTGSPCKHMCRLALELGLIHDTGVYIDDSEGVSKYSVLHAIERIEDNLNQEQQLMLRKILRKSRASAVPVAVVRAEEPICDALVEVGFLVKLPGATRSYVLSDSLQYTARKVSQYLMRKFESKTNHFDKKMPPRFPSGAKLIEAIDADTGEIYYCLTFPDDYITDELSDRGFNRLDPPAPLVKRDDGGFDYAYTAT